MCARKYAARIEQATNGAITARELRIGTALLVCNVCGSRNHLMWENVRLETPEYHQRDEFLRINKPLIQIDPRQTEIDME